jgi:hypothetical protein
MLKERTLYSVMSGVESDSPSQKCPSFKKQKAIIQLDFTENKGTLLESGVSTIDDVDLEAFTLMSPSVQHLPQCFETDSFDKMSLLLDDISIPNINDAHALTNLGSV